LERRSAIGHPLLAPSSSHRDAQQGDDAAVAGDAAGEVGDAAVAGEVGDAAVAAEVDEAEVPPLDELPASIGQSNLMIANWVVGKECDPRAFAEKLKYAPFDLVVVVLTTAVEESHDIWQHLDQMASDNPHDDECIAEVLKEKAAMRVTKTVFAVLHRAKVRSCKFRTWSIRSHGEGIAFGTLYLDIDTSRQRLKAFKIGVLDARRVASESHVAALAEWVVQNRLAMLTGFFGNHQELISRLAALSGAVWQTPLYQEVRARRSRGWQRFVQPSYFLLFGFYRAIRWPTEEAVPPDNFQLGDDIWDGMIPAERVPCWDDNEEGSVFVPNHGNVKMKPVDWERWCPHTFQTCVWLGTATPSKS